MQPGEEEPRAQDLGTYEMLWDCKFCGAEGLPARTHRHCPTCGAAQDPNTRRFPSDAEKRAVQDHVHKGADLICAACKTVNDSDARFCRQCGAPLENAERAATVTDQRRAAGEQFRASAQRDLAAERMQQDLGAAGSAAPKRTPWLLIGLGIAAAVVCVAGVIAALFWTQESTVAVTGHTWEREIAIEALLPRSESAWCSALPGDAYNVSRRREQRDTRRIPDGEDCSIRRIDNGDGTFTERQECVTRYREEPVYDDRCYYTVDRWGYARSVITSGEGLAQAPFWGSAGISRFSGVGAERESGRSETYLLILRAEDGTEYRCPVEAERWQSAASQSRWSLPVNVVTRQPDCAALAPAG